MKSLKKICINLIEKTKIPLGKNIFPLFLLLKEPKRHFIEFGTVTKIKKIKKCIYSNNLFSFQNSNNNYGFSRYCNLNLISFKEVGNVNFLKELQEKATLCENGGFAFETIPESEEYIYPDLSMLFL